MESISREIKYFVTPNNNIVRGAIDGGKLVDAEFFVSKSNEYNTPSQLNNLMKERMCLSQGKVNLKQIDRINYSNYNIPVDAGSNLVVEGGGRIPTGKNSRGSNKKIGNIPSSNNRPPRIKMNTKQSTNAGSVNNQEFIMPEVVVGGVTLNKPTKQSQSKVMSAGGNPDKKTDGISLADIFKKVSLQLAKQAEGIILEGGNPVELIKDDIVFFN